MNIFKNYFLKRQIEDWREETIINTTRILKQVTAELSVLFDEEIAKLGLNDSIINADQFIANTVAPEVRKVINLIVPAIISDANESLNTLVASHLVWTSQAEGHEKPISQIKTLFDVAIGVGPIVGGGVLAFSIPSMAVTTTSGIFGLFATSIISWPIALAIGAASMTAIGVGALNISQLNNKAQHRIRDKIIEKLHKQILQGTPEVPSILDQLTLLFNEAAEKAKSI